MDAVQAVQTVPAVQMAAGAASQAAAGSDAGEVPHLFRSMFDEAATTVASRGPAAQGPAGQQQTVRQRGIPSHFTRGAEGLESEMPASGVQENVAAAPLVGNAATRHPADQGNLPAATGGEQEEVVNGGPLWVMPEQLLMANLQPPAGMETTVTAGPAGSARHAAAAPVSVNPSLPSRGMEPGLYGMEMDVEGEPPHAPEAMKLNGPAALEGIAGDVAMDAVKPSADRSALRLSAPEGEGRGEQAMGKMTRHPELELKAEVKGETVLRQAPGGIPVSNPAQTTGMGAISRRDGLPAEALRPEPPARAESRVGGERTEPGADVVAADAAGSLSGGKESFSSWGGSQQRPDAGTGEGFQPFPGHPVGRGNSEAPVMGVEETRSGRMSGENRGQLHEEILSQVRERLESHGQGNGDGRMTLRLNPRELGELQLNVRMDDRRMSVEVTAQNPVVKEALLQNLDQLKDMLSRQNIQMERFEVATGTGQQGTGQPFREGRQGAQRQADDIPYPTAGYFREETAAVPAAGWEIRENSLIDVRL